MQKNKLQQKDYEFFMTFKQRASLLEETYGVHKPNHCMTNQFS